MSLKTILITGMSATGKSAIITDLLFRGYKAADLEIYTSIPDQSVAELILRHIEVKLR